MKAIGYIRVSTAGQAQEGVSLDNQRERIGAYCQYKGFALLDVIEDAGVSGGINRARPGFIELLDRIEQGEAEVIILYSLERLSRDMLTLLALERFLNEHDVELHTVEGHLDTSSPDGFMGFAMRAFLGEMERRQVKFRTKRALQYKKKKGEVVGAVPYGYAREGKDLVPDINEQSVIRTVNRLYSEDARLVDIVNHLNDQGRLTRAGNPWTPTQVKRLISEYSACFKKTKTLYGGATRTFIEAIA